ncbi:hypothetical protein ACJMK2_019434 [Sinanodonta woodiana]|uniref:Centrobin n=1 Tax=Sinanodonta woodiana TaxID=1069815 RepID=A0ABD3UGD7_SINWO
MNGSGIQVYSSPQKEIGGFIISCPFNQTDFLACEDPDSLVSFLNSNGASIFGLCSNDQSFFPRAFTDKELMDINNEKLQGDGDIFMMDDISDQQEIRDRKGKNLLNPAMPTHARSGPEGSPAFHQASVSQGAVTSLSNNDTSTIIFNPKKALNFSNLDDTQSDANSIHINDVGLSTPKRGSDHENYQDEYNGHHQHFYHEVTQNGPENLSTTFRELQPDGEASTYLGTGYFQPSALGLNREFLSNFTKPDQESGFDIFSPLMSRNNHDDDFGDDQERDMTPPLYSGEDLQFGAGQNGKKLPGHQNNQENSRHVSALSGNQNMDRSNNHPMFSDQESEIDHTERRIERKNVEDEEIEDDGNGMRMSHSKFQERYLTKTQVSVTIPQPVYLESRHPQESPDRQVLGSPEFDDSLDNGVEENFNEDSDTQIFQRDNRNNGSSEESYQSTNQGTINASASSDMINDRPNFSSEMHQNQQFDAYSGHGVELFKNQPNVKESFDQMKYGTVQSHRSSEPIQNKVFTQDASKLGKPKGSHFHTSAKSLNSNKVAVTGNPGAGGVDSDRTVKKHVEKKILVTKGQTASNRNGLGSGMSSSQSRQNLASNSKTITGQVRGGTGPGSIGLRGQLDSGPGSIGVRGQLDSDTQGRIKRNPQHQQGIVKPNTKVTFLATSRSDGQASYASNARVTQSSSQIHGGKKMSAKMGVSVHEPSIHETAVITQVQQISPVHLPGDKLQSQKSTANVSVDVQGMEDIRHQLKQMLQLSNASEMQGSIGQSDIQDQSEASMNFKGMEHEMQFSYNPQDEVSELYENFPSFFSSHVFSESINIPRTDTNLHAENQRLREMVEKERYRRKHCEQYIQQLNVKLLELQQQLAVAVSTDKRKDIMIEQLDKQLARVVEGWKRRDAEKDELMNKLKQDKQTIEETLKHQENVIANIEREMSDAVESLQADKDNASQTIESLNEEVSSKERERAHVADCLEAEREKVQLLQQECDHVRESRQQLDAKLGQLQSRLHKEQDDWYQREQELLQRIEEVTENNMKILQTEKVKNEEHGKLAEELMEQLQKSLTHSKKLELDLDAVEREKESLKIEMGIMEAKFENAQRKLEADLHSEMEKEIAVQVAEVLKKMERQQDELRESHTRQIIELSQRQNKEIEEHMSLFKDELSQKEDEFRRQLMEFEKTLQDYRNENTELKKTKQKLESQRLEILTKLQYLMQSQWNEAVSLLTTSPHRKPSTTLNTSLPSVASSNVHAVTGFSFNLGSPIPKQSLQQQVFDSPGRDSMVSHSTAKSHEGSPQRTRPGLNVPAQEDTSSYDEQTALSHLQEFQKYLDSFGQLSGGLPHSLDLFARPASENQSKQAQTSVQRSQESTERLNLPFKILSSDRSYQCYENQSKGSYDTSSKSAGFPSTGICGFSGSDTTTLKQKKEEEWKHKQSVSQANDLLARAVQIRPPQQHASVTVNSNPELGGPSSAGSMSYRSSATQSFSPPTKQSKSLSSQDSDEHEEEMSTVLEASSRLDDEYSSLSERVEQHETRQSELRHYVQILLNRSPVSGGGDSDNAETGSLFSQDHNEELDLNDTAQAAQLQKELGRIQELRDKQATMTDRGRGFSSNHSEKDETNTTSDHEKTGRILRPEQLANISKFLENYTTQQRQEEGEEELKHPTEQQPSNQNPDQAQIAQLIDMLQHMQTSMSPHRGKKGHSEKRSTPDKTKELNKVKRILNFQPTTKIENRNKETVPESSQPKVDSAKPSQAKKVDRKVAGAGPAPKGGQNKAPAWK